MSQIDDEYAKIDHSEDDDMFAAYELFENAMFNDDLASETAYYTAYYDQLMEEQEVLMHEEGMYDEDLKKNRKEYQCSSYDKLKNELKKQDSKSENQIQDQMDGLN